MPSLRFSWSLGPAARWRRSPWTRLKSPSFVGVGKLAKDAGEIRIFFFCQELICIFFSILFFNILNDKSVVIPFDFFSNMLLSTLSLHYFSLFTLCFLPQSHSSNESNEYFMRCFQLKHVCRLTAFEAFAVCNVQPVVHPCMRKALEAMTPTTVTTTTTTVTTTTTTTTILMEPSSLPSSSSTSIDATPSLPPVTPPPTSRRRFTRPSVASSSSSPRPSPSSSRRANPLWERATSAAASFLRRSDAVEIATSMIAVSICYQFHSFEYSLDLPAQRSIQIHILNSCFHFKTYNFVSKMKFEAARNYAHWNCK